MVLQYRAHIKIMSNILYACYGTACTMPQRYCSMQYHISKTVQFVQTCCTVLDACCSLQVTTVPSRYLSTVVHIIQYTHHTTVPTKVQQELPGTLIKVPTAKLSHGLSVNLCRPEPESYLLLATLN